MRATHRRIKFNAQQTKALREFILVSRIESKVMFHEDYYSQRFKTYSEYTAFNDYVINKCIESYKKFQSTLNDIQRLYFDRIQEYIESNFTFTLIDFDTYAEYIKTE